jgi:hypothetical protein
MKRSVRAGSFLLSARNWRSPFSGSFSGGQKIAFKESPRFEEILRMPSRTENFKSRYVSSSTFKSLTSVAAFWGLSGFPSEFLELKLESKFLSGLFQK